MCVCVSTGICEFFAKLICLQRKGANSSLRKERRIKLESICTQQFLEIKNELVDRAGFEPAASALRTRRSYQTDLPARSGAFLKKYPDEHI